VFDDEIMENAKQCHYQSFVNLDATCFAVKFPRSPSCLLPGAFGQIKLGEIKYTRLPFCFPVQVNKTVMPFQKILSTTGASSSYNGPQHSMRTSGETDSVWIHCEPYSNCPWFHELTKDLNTKICVIGSRVGGISSAYEVVKQGVNGVMIERSTFYPVLFYSTINPLV